MKRLSLKFREKLSKTRELHEIWGFGNLSSPFLSSFQLSIKFPLGYCISIVKKFRMLSLRSHAKKNKQNHVLKNILALISKSWNLRYKTQKLAI